MGSRRKAFKKALALAEKTAEQWCSDNGYSEGHLYQVFRGDRESPPMLAKIDAFIAKHLPQQAPALAS